MIQKRMTILTLMFLICFTAGCNHNNTEQQEYPLIAPSMMVDFMDPVGQIKPVNGINNGPRSHAEISNGTITWGLDKMELYQELGIPIIRTHDTEYPNGMDCFIDIHCIFPDFTKDPEDKTAYHFEYTDQYIANIRESGAEVFYRLGESIATTTADAKYQDPPENPEKWAEICAHIVAHYNAGWSKGYKYQIRYWEIWNEPDQPRQWTGDMEQYYDLYRITATRLKKQFPEIMVGASAPASATEENLQALLKGINIDGAKTPLDFLDWHIYTNDPAGISSRASLVRSVLDANGYENALSILGEWNFVEDWDDVKTSWQMIRQPKIASFYAACMIAMQEASVNSAMYYDGSLTFEYAPWCGLYDENGTLLPGLYAFQKFSQLAQLGTQVRITAKKDYSEQGIYACAASGPEKDGLLISNVGARTVRFQLNFNSGKKNILLYRYKPDAPENEQEEVWVLSDIQIMEMQAGELIWMEFLTNEENAVSRN